MDSEHQEIRIDFTGRPRTMKERYMPNSMQNIALVDYQAQIKRAIAARYYELPMLPITGAVSVEVTVYTDSEIPIVVAMKPILDALKGLVYEDDSSVRTFSIGIEKPRYRPRRGPEDVVELSIAHEESVPTNQPYKKVNYLPKSVVIKTKVRLEESPHSKDGILHDAADNNLEDAMAQIRERCEAHIPEKITGNVMLSMKVKTRDIVIDLDNVAIFYIKALEGIAYEDSKQIKYLYASFMDIDIFPVAEGVTIHITKIPD